MKTLPKWIRDRLFLFSVVIPTALAFLYYGFIAADVYISESRFVVRSPERQTTSPLGLILKGAGISRAQDDAFVVQDYILSRDAMLTLEKELGIKSAYSRPNGDFLGRFPGLDWDDSLENFYRYYQKVVAVQLDPSSSIATLTVRAFTAEEAQKINQRLLDHAEELVNRLNKRAQEDMIRFAENEVAKAEAKARQAALALADYRNRENVINPEQQAVIPLQQIAKLQEELINTQTQIAQLEQLARNNPQLPVLRKQAEMLKAEIERVSANIAGAVDKSLASKSAEFQRLALEKEFADKMLASAMSSLELARNEAQRQQLYLEHISAPSFPDAAMEPRRVRNILAVFLMGLVMWGVLSLTVAAVKEHVD
ncbi:capsule biosynthesis protein [Hydrogenophilus thiooxidans]|uniref:capsule biosynthesis protein n=1 Tax=Hydrogenophilus thiooxidans TaxID=2820326 RepID=UPI001C22F638|nr:capsule biosynthesis protein [Hydrogenophilus thiooxidans]